MKKKQLRDCCHIVLLFVDGVDEFDTPAFRVTTHEAEDHKNDTNL